MLNELLRPIFLSAFMTGIGSKVNTKRKSADGPEVVLWPF